MIEITQNDNGFILLTIPYQDEIGQINICKFIPNIETLNLTDFRIMALLIRVSINSINVNKENIINRIISHFNLIKDTDILFVKLLFEEEE